METKTAKEMATYQALLRIHCGFAQVLDALESLQQHKSYRGPTMHAAARAVRETRAGTLFEILEVLHALEERPDWAASGNTTQMASA